jgi:hypothetical protein
MAIKLRQLIENTRRVFPNTYRDADILANKVRLSRADYFVGTKTMFYSGAVISSEGVGAYTIQIRFSPVEDQNMVESGAVNARVRCSCPAFQFYIQYPLHSNQCLEGNPGRYASVPAKIKNPSNIPGLCKHLLGAMLLLHRGGRLHV